MKNRKYLYAFIVSGGLIATSFATHYIEKRNVSKNPLYELIDDLTKGYQLRQIILIVGLYIIGWLFLSFFLNEDNKYLRAFLAFPVALALWCIYSHIILLAGFPYKISAVTIFFVGGLFLGICFSPCGNKRFDYLELCICIIYVIGLASIATSGLMFTVMSGDSYHFVMEFGQMIVKQGIYEPETMGTLLTWTGISPALFSALAELAGFETIYGIHHMLMISFWGFQSVYLYTEINVKNKTRKKMWVIIPIVTLLSNKVVIILTGWIISTAYWMVYHTILIILLYERYYKKNTQINLIPCIMLFSVMLTITRGEAIILLIYIFICLSITGIAEKELRMIMAPCVLIEMLFFYKVFFVWEIQGSNLLTKNNAGLITAIIISGVFYTLLYKKIREKHIINLLYVGLGSISLIVFVFKTQQFIDNLAIALNNFGGEQWGTLPWIIMILLTVQVVTWKGIPFLNLIWTGEIILSFLMNSVRYIGLRSGIGDSFNRMLIAMMPLIMLSIICGIQKEKNENEYFMDYR